MKYPTFVPLLFTEKVRVKKMERKWLRMLFWIRREEFIQRETCSQIVEKIQAECAVTLCGLALPLELDASNERVKLDLQVLSEHTSPAYVLQIGGLHEPPKLKEAVGGAVVDTLLDIYVAHGGKYDRLQLGHSKQLSASTVTDEIKQCLRKRHLAQKLCQEEQETKDSSVDNLLEAFQSCRGKVLETKNLRIAAGYRTLACYLLQSHGYEQMEVWPEDADHSAILVDLILQHDGGVESMKGVLSKAVEEDLRGRDWKSFLSSLCEKQSMPNLLQAWRSKGLPDGTALEMLVGLGRLEAAAESACEGLAEDIKEAAVEKLQQRKRSKLAWTLKRCADTHGLPSEVEEMIAKVIIDLTEGESSTFRRAEPVDFSDLAETMRVAVEAVNEEVAVSLEDVRRHNQSLLSELANGSIKAEECEDGLLEEPKPVSLKSIPNMVRSLKKKYGFSRQKVNTAGTYLEPDDPVMLESLARFQKYRQDEQIPLELTLNYDQTWVQPWRSSKAITMRKQSKKSGRKAVTRVTAISGARAGITMVTSSWACGQRGPLFICVGKGAVKESFVTELNQKYEGEVMLIRNDSKTHFMNSESTLVMYQELLTKAFQKQREKHHMESQRGLLVADGFTGNYSNHSGLGLLRHKWAALNNIRLPSVEPGGWSAHGQPQDQIHGFFKSMNDASAQKELQFSKLQIGTSGQSYKKASVDSCIQLVVDNWLQFPSILLQKAWVRTRHVSLEEMKAMNGSTDDDFAQSEQWCDPSGLAGVLGYEGASAPNADDMELNQVDRKVLLWEIKNPDTDQWALLPASLVFSLEKRLANYVHQVAQKQPMPVWASVCWNTRLAKEASPSWVAQNTVHSPGGKRHFSDKISKKASKELVLLHFQCDKLQLVVGDEGKVRQLNYVMLNPDSVDPSISTFSVADVHKQFA
ncbi:unnamed protein product, partial [Durusdinium trenchii]